MTSNLWIIYSLHDISTPSIPRYVGYSTIPMMRTFVGRHIERAANSHHYPVYEWMRSIGEENVGFNIIEICPSGDIEYLYSREIYWIAFYRELQGSLLDKKTENYLTNIADGGLGILGYVASDEHRANLSKSLTGKPKSEEHRKNIGLASKGRRHSEESRARQSIIRSGLNNPNYGRIWSDETNQKRSESLKGHTVSDETRQKMKHSSHLYQHVKMGRKSKTSCEWCTT